MARAKVMVAGKYANFLFEWHNNTHLCNVCQRSTHLGVSCKVRESLFNVNINNKMF